MCHAYGGTNQRMNEIQGILNNNIWRMADVADDHVNQIALDRQELAQKWGKWIVTFDQ